MSGSKGLLSICCTCYNHEKYIEDCIKSIWNNDYKNIEIIVVDDGSKDNSVNILKKLKETSPYPFKLIVQENTHNIGLNFNRALKKANGEFVTFMSCDDYYTENAFLKKIDILTEDKNVALVISRHVILLRKNDKIKNKLVWTADENITNEELCNIEYKQGTFAIQGNVFRKSIIDEVNGFDEDIHGDDIIIRTKVLQYMEKNPQCILRSINEPSFVYRIHSGSYSSNLKNIINILLDTYDRYWPNKKYAEYVELACLKWLKTCAQDECTYMCKKHPSFSKLTHENNLYLRYLYLRILKKYRTIFWYIFRKEKLKQHRICYTILNLIKISIQNKHK